MPEEEMWASFFNVGLILSKLQISSEVKDLVEVGCGYGTFTIPAAEAISGKLIAFDIEKGMIEIAKHKAENRQLRNISFFHRDILYSGTGLPDNSIDYVMLFNILHHEAPKDFLDEAHRILKSDGKLGILHWRSDINTPRGPDLDIRPRPDQILAWLDKNCFSIQKPPFILEPYHFGLIASKI